MRHFTCFCVVLLSLVCSGCAWERKLVFTNPSGNTSVEIEQPFPANGWGLRVLLDRNGLKQTLYQMRGDVFLDFADVDWDEAPGIVAIFTCGTPTIRLAYSLNENNFVPFSRTATALAAHIRRKYRLANEASDQNTFDWACSQAGKDAFLRVHPDASPR